MADTSDFSDLHHDAAVLKTLTAISLGLTVALVVRVFCSPSLDYFESCNIKMDQRHVTPSLRSYVP
jgi:hypothetical protein